ncbi:MAG TPA: carbohydrate ABC transporter permease [Ktedonobacteraceae bacterium]|jgi:multiple sugar transport system permease protein|nr:carbohydrate ABC transporter permease [Ktedonobacteraceae bacterium]
MQPGLRRFSPVAMTVIGIILTLIMLFPLYWMLINSLETSQQIFAIPVAIVPSQITFASYIEVFQTQLPHLVTSLVISIGTALLAIVIATPAAYGLAHFRFRVTLLIVFCLLLTQMIPTVTLATPMFLIFNKLGLLNSYLGLVLADSTYAVPFAILILRAFFLSIPYELAQAAFVDGTGEWGAFIRVILPLVLPGVVTAALFAFLFAWGDFIYALTLITTSSIVVPVSLSIYSYIGQYSNAWNNAMAVATLACIPAAILLVLFQRYITAGLTSGALKG